MKVGELYAVITANDSGFRKAMSRVHQAMARAKDASTAFTGVVGGVATAMGAAAFKGVTLAAQMEQTRVAFTTLLGSAQKADAFLKDLWDFAAKTPFEFEGLTQSSRKLLAFGFQAKDIIPTMQAVGDAIAALGGGAAEIDRAVYALGQMQAKGKVSAEEMMQLAELGIPVWQMLADAIGTSIPEAMEKASKGAIPAAKGIEAILNGMTKRYQGAMEQQSKTILGRWSTIQDAISGILRSIGEELINTFNIGGLLDRVGEALGRLSDVLSSKGLQGLKELLPPWFAPVATAIAGAILGGMVPALVALATSAWSAVTALAPFIAAGAAIGAAAYLIYRNWDQVKNLLASLQPVVAPAIEAVRATIADLVNYVQERWPAIQATIQQFLTWAGPIFRLVFQGIWSTVQFYFNAVKDVVVGVIRVLTGIWKFFAAVLSGDWRGAWQAIKQVFSGAVQALWGLARLWIAGRLMGLFGKALQWILGRVAGFVGGLVGRFSGGLARAGGVIRSGLAKARNHFVNFVREALGAIGRMGSRLFEIGKNLVTGLWRGISNMAGWLKEKVLGWARNVLPGPIAKLLGIQSPSRLMMEYGRELARGLAVGILRHAQVAERAATRLAEAVQASTPELADRWRRLAVPRLPDAQAARREPIILQATFQVDGRTMGRVMVPYVDELMAMRQALRRRALGEVY